MHDTITHDSEQNDPKINSELPDHNKSILDNLDQLKTGDILLFNEKSFWFSRLVEYWTGSPWSHVAIVLRDPTYLDPKLTGLYLWESGEEDFPDAEDHQMKFGVQITDLKKVISEYDGKIVVRKLSNITNN